MAQDRDFLPTPAAVKQPSWKGLILRQPGKADAGFQPPVIELLQGRWQFAYSTLPIWRDKRNISITYKIVPSEQGKAKERLDDVVEYQHLGKDKIESVRGRNVEKSDQDTGGWDWRGKGVIKVASSHWDILGWGVDHYAAESGEDGVERLWMVTFFVKTVFTPAAIDIRCRHPDGLSDQLVADIKRALLQVDNPSVKSLAGQLCECRRDNTEVNQQSPLHKKFAPVKR